jgi:hypothetical protein
MAAYAFSEAEINHEQQAAPGRLRFVEGVA